MIGRTTASQLLRSFRLPNFRMMWFSDATPSSAEQIEFLVLAWFVLTETNSPFLVGLFAALRFTGTLLSPYYGILVDRYDRKRLLAGARMVFAVAALLVIFLSATDQLQVWHVFVLVAVVGMGRSFDNVTRQTMIADIVDRRDLSNAIALTRNGRDATQIVGPVIGGIMLGRLGMSWTYALIAALYAVGALFASRLSLPARTPIGRRSIIGDLAQTGRYVRREEVILALLLLAFIVNLTGFPLNLGLMPVFARDVLGTDSAGLGQLLGAYAIGGFLGSMTIAGLSRMRRPGKVMLTASIAWHACIILVSQMKWFGPSVGLLLVIGVAQSFAMVTMSVLLLAATSPELRGRVMGLRSLAVYGLPIGLLVSGAVAERFGVPVAFLINGGLGIILTAAIATRLRGLWRAS